MTRVQIIYPNSKGDGGYGDIIYGDDNILIIKKPKPPKGQS